MALALVTVGSAKVALANFRRRNFSVDPEDPDHQQAYMTLRDTHGRVNGRMLVNFLNTRQQQVSSGQRNVMYYWAVPRCNFPRGLPPAIAAAEVSADNARHVKGFSPDQVWLIDQSTPRTDLGLDVWIAKRFVGLRPPAWPHPPPCSLPRTSVLQPQATVEPQEAAVVPQAAAVEPQTAAQPPAVAGWNGIGPLGTTVSHRRLNLPA